MAKEKFDTRIHRALIENGVEYEKATRLVNYQEKRALKLLNMILKEKRKWPAKIKS